MVSAVVAYRRMIRVNMFHNYRKFICDQDVCCRMVVAVLRQERY